MILTTTQLIGLFALEMTTGAILGLISATYNWSRLKLIVLSFFTGLALSCAYILAFGGPAQANDLAFSRLEATTLHLSAGSGFIYKSTSGKYYLITNWHVCTAMAWQGKMHASYEGGKALLGIVVKKDPVADLCASLLPPTDRPYLKVAKSLEIGEAVFTRGYPFGILSNSEGYFIGNNSWEYTFDISVLGECFKGSTVYRDGLNHITGCGMTYDDNLTTLYSRPGSSGSPVVNSEGELVGVMSSWFGDSDAGGMVKLSVFKKFVKGL